MAKYGRWTDAKRRALVADHARSGLTVRKFAAASGVPMSTLQRWRRRYPESDAPPAPRLVTVDVREDSPTPTPARSSSPGRWPAPLAAAASRPATFEVAASGFTVQVPADFDADALTRLLRTVRAC